MRILSLFFLISSPLTHANTIATANVYAPNCIDSHLIQLIVIKKDVADQFMYQVGVPHAGSADFNFIPGEYRIEAISDKACFGKVDFKISENQADFALNLELAP